MNSFSIDNILGGSNISTDKSNEDSNIRPISEQRSIHCKGDILYNSANICDIRKMETAHILYQHLINEWNRSNQLHS